MATHSPDHSPDVIRIRGAREHNLKNLNLELPRERLIVFTGLSGSGKSSLAFDTIYAEGQRRYVESLSAYARQFLGQMDKPDVDFIEGLSPAISIDQKTASRNPRSTVGTVTEIHDYLRLMWARIGIPHCPNDGTPLVRQTPQQIVDQILELPEGTRFQVLAPVVRGRKGEYETLLKDLASQGFARAEDRRRYSGADRGHPPRPLLPAQHRSRGRSAGQQGRNPAAAHRVARAGSPPGRGCGRDRGDRRPHPHLLPAPGLPAWTASRSRNCSLATSRSTALTALVPSARESGLAIRSIPELVVPDPDRSIREGAIAPWSSMTADYHKRLLEGLATELKFSTDTPVQQAAEEGARHHPQRPPRSQGKGDLLESLRPHPGLPGRVRRSPAFPHPTA